MDTTTRRGALRAVLAGGIAALAGCTGGGGGKYTQVTTTSPKRTSLPATGKLPASGTVPQYRYTDHKTAVAKGKGPRGTLKRAWSYDTEDKIRTSPAVVDGTVYVGDDAARMHAIDLASGDRAWTHDTHEKAEYLIDASPAVADGAVVFSATTAKSDGTVVALETESGEPRWSKVLERSARASPVVGDGAVYVGGGRGVYRLDLASGEQTWWLNTSTAAGMSEGGDNPIAAGIALANGTVVAGTRSGHVFGVDAATGEKRWGFETGRSIQATPAIANGTVYVGSYDSNLYALSLADGTKRWTYEADGWIDVGAAVADGTVYVGTQEGTLHAVSADDGSKEWTRSLGWKLTGAPVVAGNAVIASTHPDGRTVAVARSDGSTRWSFRARGSVQAPVTVVENAALIPSLDGRLYAIYS